MKKYLHLYLSLICAAVASSCGSVLTSNEPAEHVYWLEPATLRLGNASTEVLPDLVVVVNTVPGLDTDRILVKGPGARLNHYAGARWPDHLPEVLTATVRMSLESSGRFNRVGSGTRTGSSEWSLELELREFFAVVDTADALPEVRVRLVGHLSCVPGETPVSATATSPTQANTLTSIVAAFQAATNDVLTDLGRKLEATCLEQ